MYASIQDVQNIIQASENLWDATNDIIRNLKFGLDGYLDYYEVKSDYTTVVVNYGFDSCKYHFPSVYYTMAKEEYIPDWEMRQAERQKKLEEEQAQREKEEERLEAEKERQLYLELKKKYG